MGEPRGARVGVCRFGQRGPAAWRNVPPDATALRSLLSNSSKRGGSRGWLQSLGLSVAMAVATGLGSISHAAEPAVPPGFCLNTANAEAELAWGAYSTASVHRSVQSAVFVDCAQLRDWRAGRRGPVSVYGAVTLYRGAEEVQAAFPELTALRQPAATRATGPRAVSGAAPLGLVQQRIEDGVLYRTRLVEKGAPLPIDIQWALPRRGQETGAGDARPVGGGGSSAPALMLHLSAAALGPDASMAIERAIVMPYEGDDSLRYLQASLLAGVAADRLTLLALR